MPFLTVAHDVICPWCWVAWRQGKQLREEFPMLELRWVGYELLPDGLPYTPTPPDPNAAIKPRVPSRFDLLLTTERLPLPVRTRDRSVSRLALEGAEFAYELEGTTKAEAYLDALYHAYWEESQDIADRSILNLIATKAGLNIASFAEALDTHVYRSQVIEYDDPAHDAGVWNVPTWMFPEEWIAEQPYSVIREFATRFLKEI